MIPRAVRKETTKYMLVQHQDGLSMWKEPALWVVVLAILASVISRWLPAPRREKIMLPSVFVCVVSFCDATWPTMVQQLLGNACARDTLRIGVVEFVRNVVDTREPDIPVEWRHAVRVYTVSHHVATTQRAARRLCVKELYQNEPHCLFLGAASLCPEWDRRLFDMLPRAKTILSTNLTRDQSATFPCLDGTRLTHRPLALAKPVAVASLVTQSAFLFVPADAVDLALSSSDDVAVSEALVTAGYCLCVPGIPVAFRARHPTGIAVGKLGARTPRAQAYADERGFGRTQTAYARLGLLPDADSEEAIAKYGSVVGARLAIQEEEATTR